MRLDPILPKRPLFDYDKMVSGFVRAMSDTVKAGQAQMQNYPPQMPSISTSRYVRTGTLRRSWSSGVEQGANRIVGITGSNANIASYNRPVQGKEQLPLFNFIGWPDVIDLKKEVERQLPPRLREAVKSAVPRAT